VGVLHHRFGDREELGARWLGELYLGGFESHRVLLDAAPQPLLTRRLGDNIDRAAENAPNTPDQRFQPSEIGEPALCGRVARLD
jgi:hypothetical protein